mgnify:CR=1 FL=1
MSKIEVEQKQSRFDEPEVRTAVRQARWLAFTLLRLALALVPWLPGLVALAAVLPLARKTSCEVWITSRASRRYWLQSEFSLWDTGGGGPRVVLGLGLSVRRFLRFVRSARFLRGARRGPARPYLLAFSAHHPRPSSPPSRTHVLSCARRARSPPRWRQERLFNTLRWRCAAPAVTASCAASRLAERERRSTRHGTAPNIPRLARVLPALCPQSLLLTLSPRVSCAARPHVRRPSAARERSALWWRHELLCHRLSAAKGFCQRHTPPFPDRPSNQNGKATLASPARRLPECTLAVIPYSRISLII